MVAPVLERAIAAAKNRVRLSFSAPMLGLTAVQKISIPGLTVAGVRMSTDRRIAEIITDGMTLGDPYTVTIDPAAVNVGTKKSLRFVRANSYTMQSVSTALIPSNANHTIAFLVKMTGNATQGYLACFSKGTTGSTPYYSIWIQDNARAYFNYGASLAIYDDLLYRTGDWLCFVLAYESTGFATFYVNGNPIGRVPVTPQDSQAIRLGSWGAAHDYRADGNMRQFGIWQGTTLTETQAKALTAHLMSGQDASTFATAPTTLWPMEAINSNQVLDTIGTEHLNVTNTSITDPDNTVPGVSAGVTDDTPETLAFATADFTAGLMPGEAGALNDSVDDVAEIYVSDPIRDPRTIETGEVGAIVVSADAEIDGHKSFSFFEQPHLFANGTPIAVITQGDIRRKGGGVSRGRATGGL